MTALSPLQAKFRSDPEGYFATLLDRAERLFENGYRADAAAMPHVFIVRRGAGSSDPREGEGRYLVHAIKQTCSCPFFERQAVEPLCHDKTRVPCKHLLGLEALVKLTAEERKATRDLHRYYRLVAHWMGVLAERHRGEGSLRRDSVSLSSTKGIVQ